jgi:hypothetical protein
MPINVDRIPGKALPKLKRPGGIPGPRNFILNLNLMRSKRHQFTGRTWLFGAPLSEQVGVVEMPLIV